MSNRGRRRGALIALVAGASIALAGCSVAPSSTTTPEPTSSDGTIDASPTATPTVPVDRAGTHVTVIEKEYSIAVVGTTHFSPGTYTFDVVNDGLIAHNLHITGPGIEDAGSDNVASTHSTTLTVTLEDGVYTLFCAAGDQRAKGMELQIAVGSATLPNASPSP